MLQASSLQHLILDCHHVHAGAFRRSNSQEGLGRAWAAVEPLIFATQPRIAAAASGCLGALGIAIFTADGALMPIKAPSPAQASSATPEKQAGGGRSARRRRGGQRGAAQVAAADAGGGASPATPHKLPQGSATPAQASPSTARLQAVPATHAVSWAVSQLAQAQSSSSDSSSGSQASKLVVHKQLVAVVTNMIKPAKAAPSAALAAHILRAMQRLLDADTTTAAQLPAYLDIMLAAMQVSAAADAGPVLPDILDVFLGWALDSSCDQQSRWAMTQAPGAHSVTCCCARMHANVCLKLNTCGKHPVFIASLESNALLVYWPVH